MSYFALFLVLVIVNIDHSSATTDTRRTSTVLPYPLTTVVGQVPCQPGYVYTGNVCAELYEDNPSTLQENSSSTEDKHIEAAVQAVRHDSSSLYEVECQKGYVSDGINCLPLYENEKVKEDSSYKSQSRPINSRTLLFEIPCRENCIRVGTKCCRLYEDKPPKEGKNEESLENHTIPYHHEILIETVCSKGYMFDGKNCVLDYDKSK